MHQDLLQGTDIVTVGQVSINRAQELVTACSACSMSAHCTFESILNQVLGGREATQYLLEGSAECPRCGATLLEASRVSTCQPGVELDSPAEDNNNVAFVDENTLAEAESFISGCEYCQPETAAMPFDQLLDAFTGYAPNTEYITCHAARCAQCNHEVTGNTLIFSA